MEIVLLFEDKKNRPDLVKQITDAGHSVVECGNTNDFFEAVEKKSADRYVIDVKSWFRAVTIYRLFALPTKFNETPVIFFNAPEGFAALEGRSALPGDVVLEKEEGRDRIVECLG